MASMSSSQNGGLASKDPLSGEKSRQGLGTEVSILSPTRTQSLSQKQGPPPLLFSPVEEMALMRPEAYIHPEFVLGQGVATSIK